MSESVNILARLRDIREPAAPEASAISLILVVAVFLTAVLLSLLVALWWQKRRKSWISRNVAELQKFKYKLQSIDNIGKPEEELSNLAQILRRHVVGLQPEENRQNVAHLSGNAWLDFLNHTFATQYFTKGLGKLFGNSLYTGEAQHLNTLNTYNTNVAAGTNSLVEICNRLESLFIDHNRRSTIKSRAKRNRE